MRTIIAAGGIETPEQEERFAVYYSDFVRRRSGKSRPVICLMAQAQGEREDLVARNIALYDRHGCDIEVLRTFSLKKPFAESAAESDAFFVTGGSTVNMLAIWQARGLDVLLRAAYDAGKPIAGYSAGALCWFEKMAVPDPSVDRRYSIIDGLGWLQGSYAPHYLNCSWRKDVFEKHVGSSCLPSGIGCDDGVFALYENEVFQGFYSVEEKARGYRVVCDDRAVAVTDIVVPERIT